MKYLTFIGRDGTGIKCKSYHSIFYVFYISIFQVEDSYNGFGANGIIIFISNITYNVFPYYKSFDIINELILDEQTESNLAFNHDKNVGRGWNIIWQIFRTLMVIGKNSKIWDMSSLSALRKRGVLPHKGFGCLSQCFSSLWYDLR